MYQEVLDEWIPRYLALPGNVLTWETIAEHCLQIKRESWSNKALQAEVTSTLHLMGYRRGRTRVLQRTSGASLAQGGA